MTLGSTTSVPAAPTLRGRRAAVASVTLGTFALVSTEFLPVGMLEQIASGLDVSPGTAGLLITLPGLAAAISSPVLTLSARRADRRLILLALSGLLVVSGIVSALAPSFAVLLVARLLLGLALGGFWSTGLSLAVRLVAPESGGRATAAVLAGISAGTLFGVPAGTLIGDRAGWRTAFWIVAVLAAVALLAQARLVPPVPTATAVHSRDLVAVLSHRATRRVLMAVALAVSGHFAAYSYVTPYLTQVAGLEVPLVAGLLLAYAVAGSIGNAVAGATVGPHVRATALAAAATIAPATALLVPLLGSGAAVAVLLVLWGLGFGALPPPCRPGPTDSPRSASPRLAQLCSCWCSRARSPSVPWWAEWSSTRPDSAPTWSRPPSCWPLPLASFSAHGRRLGRARARTEPCSRPTTDNRCTATGGLLAVTEGRPGSVPRCSWSSVGGGDLEEIRGWVPRSVVAGPDRSKFSSEVDSSCSYLDEVAGVEVVADRELAEDGGASAGRRGGTDRG